VADLGRVLAHGQTIRHTFVLSNPGPRPVRVLSGLAETPCCSSIAALPESIPQGGRAEVRVELRPGHQSGRKMARFVVMTDDPTGPAKPFALVADLVAELEVDADPRPILKVGEGGRTAVRVVARRLGESGRDAIVGVSASAPLLARLRHEPTTTSEDGGLVESSTEVEVVIPPVRDAGDHAGSLVLRFPDGSELSHAVSWRVVPRVAVIPASLLVHAGPGPVRRTVRVVTGEAPFRLLGIDGPHLAGSPRLPTLPASQHALDVELDVAGCPPGTAFDLHLALDHPHHASVPVSVLVLPAPSTSSSEDGTSP
jgi:hypothetical protein